MNLQQVRGNVRTAESRRKARNRKKAPKVVSRHTKRFRALFEPVRFPDGSLGAGRRYVGDSPPVLVRSMASVGGPTRRAMKEAHPHQHVRHGPGGDAADVDAERTRGLRQVGTGGPREVRRIEEA